MVKGSYSREKKPFWNAPNNKPSTSSPILLSDPVKEFASTYIYRNLVFKDQFLKKLKTINEEYIGPEC